MKSAHNTNVVNPTVTGHLHFAPHEDSSKKQRSSICLQYELRYQILNNAG